MFGNVFGLDRYRDTTTRFAAFTKEDNRRLQVLQNTVLRLLTGARRGTQTTTLLEITDTLSVQQLVAFQTLVMLNKVITTSVPFYLAKKLKVENQEVQVRSQGSITAANQNLSLSRDGFIVSGTYLFNSLPLPLRQEQNLKKFNEATRKWVKRNISAKPP